MVFGTRNVPETFFHRAGRLTADENLAKLENNLIT